MKSREIEAYLPGSGNTEDSSNNAFGLSGFPLLLFFFLFLCFFCFPVFFPPAPSSSSPIGFFSCSSLLPVLLFFPGFLVLSPSPVSSAFVLPL